MQMVISITQNNSFTAKHQELLGDSEALQEFKLIIVNIKYH